MTRSAALRALIVSHDRVGGQSIIIWSKTFAMGSSSALSRASLWSSAVVSSISVLDSKIWEGTRDKFGTSVLCTVRGFRSRIVAKIVFSAGKVEYFGKSTFDELACESISIRR